jgi:hypothetical protein
VRVEKRYASGALADVLYVNRLRDGRVRRLLGRRFLEIV